MRKYLIVLILLLFVSACHPIPSEENCSSEGMDATNNASSAHKSTPSSENQFNTEKDSQTAVYFLGNYIKDRIKLMELKYCLFTTHY